jgi:glycosyltransferase involved in cell wall biosynthesis
MPDSKLSVVDNGVVIPATPSLPPVGPPWAVISISRFDVSKNSAFLIEIIQELFVRKRLGEFVFHVVGDGPDREKLVALAGDLGFSEILFCPGATLVPHDMFAGALCYLSTSKWEGLPLAVLEAMAHGLPVVATDVVGNRDVVFNGQTGFLYPEGDAESAVASLICLSEDAERRYAMGQRARAFVTEAHNVQRMAERTYQILRDACRDF